MGVKFLLEYEARTVHDSLHGLTVKWAYSEGPKLESTDLYRFRSADELRAVARRLEQIGRSTPVPDGFDPLPAAEPTTP